MAGGWLAKAGDIVAAGVRSARSPPPDHAGVAQRQSSRLLTGRPGFDTLRPHHGSDIDGV